MLSVAGHTRMPPCVRTSVGLAQGLRCGAHAKRRAAGSALRAPPAVRCADRRSHKGGACRFVVDSCPKKLPSALAGCAILRSVPSVHGNTAIETATRTGGATRAQTRLTIQAARGRAAPCRRPRPSQRGPRARPAARCGRAVRAGLRQTQPQSQPAPAPAQTRRQNCVQTVRRECDRSPAQVRADDAANRLPASPAKRARDA